MGKIIIRGLLEKTLELTESTEQFPGYAEVWANLIVLLQLVLKELEEILSKCLNNCLTWKM